MAARQQADRILGAADPMSLRGKGDFYLFVVAIRNVRRAAELVLQVAPAASRAAIERALEDFDKELPGAVEARDVLEHFDDYALGVGRLTKKEQVPIVVEWFENRGDDLAIYLGVGRQKLLRIGIRQGQRAAFALRDEVSGAVHDALHPGEAESDS